jgi:ABC-type amino acid transport system permease subunit
MDNQYRLRLHLAGCFVALCLAAIMALARNSGNPIFHRVGEVIEYTGSVVLVCMLVWWWFARVMKMLFPHGN